MSTDFPQLIDPWQAARLCSRYEAPIAIHHLQRIRDKRADVAAESEQRAQTVQFSAQFAFNDRRQPQIRIQVQAALALRCQRTLKVYLERIETDSQVVVVNSLAEAESLAEDLEPYWLPEGERLSLRHLVEEEILLALPLVPVAPDTAAADAAEVPAAERRQKPFVALAEMLALAREKGGD